MAQERRHATVEGTPVNLHHRSPVLSAIYIVAEHSKAPDFGPYRNKIYVALMDTSHAHAKKVMKQMKKTKIPIGRRDAIEREGYLVLKKGDCLIIRDIHGPGTEETDKLQVWVTPPEYFKAEDKQRVNEARDRLLGPVDARTAAKGGVYYERFSEAKSLPNGPRCYTAGPSYQAPRKTTGPSFGTKLANTGELTEHQRLRKNMLEAATAIGVAAMETAKDESNRLRKRSEMLNLPRTGCRENYYFQTSQINLSPAQGSDAAAAQAGFESNMGSFGQVHVDKNDALQAFTHLLACSALLGEEDPGYFFILTLGVCVELTDLCSVIFSGRHIHGGYPPTAQEGGDPNPHSYRVVVVSYPPSVQYNAKGKFAFAHLPDGVLHLCKEWMSPKYDRISPTGSTATMVGDGLSMMDEGALMEYFSRAMVQFVYGLMKQLPPSLAASFDPDALLRSISYKPSDADSRVSMDPWPSAPRFDPAGRAQREEAHNEWRNNWQQMLRFFPEHLEKFDEFDIIADEGGQAPAPVTTVQSSSDEGPVLHHEYNSADEHQPGQIAPGTIVQRGKPGRKRAPTITPATFRSNKRHRKDSTIDLAPATQRSTGDRMRRTILKNPGVQQPGRGGGRTTDSAMDTSEGGYVASSDSEDEPLLLRNTQRSAKSSSMPESSTSESAGTSGSLNASAEMGPETTSADESSSDEPTGNAVRIMTRRQHGAAHVADASAARADSESSNEESPPPPEDDGGEYIEPKPKRRAVRPPLSLSLTEYQNVWVQSENIQARAQSEAPCHSLAQHSLQKSLRPTASDYHELLAVFSWSSLYGSLVDLEAVNDTLQGGGSSQTQLPPDAHRIVAKVISGAGKNRVQYRPDYVADLSELWSAVKVQENRSQLHDYQVAMANAELMLAVGVAWTWLDVDVLSMVKEIADNKAADAPGWLVRLTGDLKEYLSGRRTATFRPSDYGIIATKPQPITLSLHTGLALQGDMPTRICSVAHTVLTRWLNYPGGISRIQGTFIRHLVSAFGTGDVLLLPRVWSTYRKAKSILLVPQPSDPDTGQPLPFVPQLLDYFLDDLLSLPLADRASDEYELLTQISSEYDEYRALWRQILGKTPGKQGIAIAEDASDRNPFYHTPYDPSLDYRSQAVDKITDFIRTLLPLLTSRDDDRRQLEPLAELVQRDPDYYLPFRQRAPQLRGVTAAGSFLHPDNIDKQGAIASLWCWRGIFYRSQFSYDHLDQLFFPTLTAWTKKRYDVEQANMKNGQSQLSKYYFCRSDAYGSASRRHEKHAEKYFAAEPRWRQLFQNQPQGWKLPYRAAYAFAHELPQIGGLQSALIASDLVYAGKVEMPTPAEMGTLVCELNLGALRCLSCLYLFHSTISQELVSETFTFLYDHVRERFSDPELNEMCFDPIMFEHLLCKYPRATKRYLRTNS